MKNALWIVAFLVVIAMAGCESAKHQGGDQSAGTRTQKLESTHIAQPTPQPEAQEDENLAPLPPQIVGGAFLTTQLLCGEVEVPDLKLNRDEAAFGCMIVDGNEQPVRLHQNRKEWQLVQHELGLMVQAIAYRELPLHIDSPFAALFIVPRSSLQAGIQTSVTITGKKAQQIKYAPVLDVQSQAKLGNDRPLIIINQYGSAN
jgi:hypothetical protein